MNSVASVGAGVGVEVVSTGVSVAVGAGVTSAPCLVHAANDSTIDKVVKRNIFFFIIRSIRIRQQPS